jgi:hypothetical protein
VSFEVTHSADPTEPVSLTLSGLPTYVDTDDSSRVTVLIPPGDAEFLGEALARMALGPDDRRRLLRLRDDRDHWESEACAWQQAAEEARAALDAAWKSAHAQNEEGAKARSVVAAVARILGVDIDEGDGHRWDEDHMRRVVDAAQRFADERGAAEAKASQRGLRVRAVDGKPGMYTWRVLVDAAAEEVSGRVAADELHELRATIVRQAVEITELKGERV